ncbi:hypothetical protein HN873_050073 [Arachis hypogaea]|uniref:F-box domain-containing protein n=1 Tax=Arachis hypogaea TaxID=3818 RepID=A0A444WNM0_ARAHY|nr:F-box protein [Arachis hypogaea]RYQ79010.1 hypothetical protein Ahy_Scaffold8g108490 [Arachis hypogaea]
MDNNQKSINDLPLELFQAILLRVQAKDLFRLKFVSKLWFSLISDSNFVELHLHHSSGFAPSLFFNKNNEEARLVDLHALYNEDAEILHAAIKDVPLPFGNNKKERDSYYFVVLGSCRGFVFLHREPGFIIIWNPVTGSCKKISYGYSIKKDAILYGVAYDASNDDYLIVIADKRYRFDCFSLRTNSWIKIDAVFPFPISILRQCLFYSPGLFFNGAIHWMIIQDSYYKDMLIFDVKERSFSMIALPEKEHVGTLSDLVILGECLALYLLSYNNGYKTRIWVMKEYKVRSSWTLYEIHNICMIPLALSSNGSDFIMLDTKSDKIHKYNLEGELLQCLQHYSDVIHGGFFGRCTVYTESLATLPKKN